MNIFDLQAKISLDASEFNTGIEQASTAMGTLGGGLSAGAVAMGNLVAGAVTTAASDLVDFGKSAIDTGMNFDAAMSNVKAISGATGEEFDALRDKAKQMGATTAFTATEAAEAFSYMAMAGWKTEDMLAGIEGIMNLAAASGESLGSTSDIVTDALTAFGLTAEDSGHFADVLAAASSNANTNVGMMGETFKYAAPVAGALGFSIEDTAQAIGLMANAGIKGSQAGTALRSIFTRLSKPTKESSTAMNILGISLDDTEGNMKSLGEVMEEIRKGFEGNLKISTEEYTDALARLNDQLERKAITKTDYQSALELLDTRLNGSAESVQAMFAAMLGGQEAMSGLLAIVNASSEDFGKLSDAIEGASEAAEGQGVAYEMAQTQLDNLSGKVTIFQSALDGFKTAIYDKFAGPLSDAVTVATDALGAITEGFEEGGLKGAIESLGSFAKERLSGIWDDLKLPAEVHNIAGAIRGIIDAFPQESADTISSIAEAVDDFMEGFNNTGANEALASAAESAGEFFEKFLIASAETVKNISDATKDFIEAFDGKEIGGIVGGIAKSAGELFEAFTKVGAQTVEDIAAGIEVFLENVDKEKIADTITEIAGTVGDLFDKFAESSSERINTAREALSGFFEKVGEGASSIPGNVAGISRELSRFLDTLGELSAKIDEKTAPIREFLEGTFWRLFSSTILGAVSAVDHFTSSIEHFLSAFNHAVDSVKHAFEGDWHGVLNDLLNWTWDTTNGMQEAFEGLVDPLVVAADDFFSAGEGLASGLWDGMKSKWDSFTTWVAEAGRGLVSLVTGLFKEHSPSRVFADIGANLVLGMGQGWSSEWGDLERTVDGDLSGLIDTAKIGFGDSAIGKSSAAGITSLLTAGAGASSAPIEINLVLDGDVAATALYDPLRRVAFQKGKAEAVYA